MHTPSNKVLPIISSFSDLKYFEFLDSKVFLLTNVPNPQQRISNVRFGRLALKIQQNQLLWDGIGFIAVSKINQANFWSMDYPPD